MRLTFSQLGKWIVGLIILVVIVPSVSGCFLRNQPPITNSLTAELNKINPSHSYTIKCVASDPDDDSLSYEWSASGGSISEEGATVAWTAPNEVGIYKIIVVVTDDRGGEATQTVEVKVGHG